MSRRRYFRIILRLSIIAVIGLALAVLSANLWLPQVLPALLRSAGVTVAGVARLDDGRLSLKDLSLQAGSTTVGIDRIETPNVHTVLIDRFSGRLSAASQVRIGRITVRTMPSPHEDSEKEMPAPPLKTVRAIRSALSRYEPWLPPVKISALDLYAGDKTSPLSLKSVEFSDWKLTGTATLPGFPGELRWHASLDPDMPWNLTASSAAMDLKAGAGLREADESLQLALQVASGSETIEAEATFSAGRWIPGRASLRSEHFTIRPDWIPFQPGIDVESLDLTQLDLVWNQGNYEGTLHLDGTLGAAGINAVPLHVAIALSGDRGRLQIQTLELSSDWADLTLGAPVRFNLKRGGADGEGALDFRVDLAKQPFIDAGGILEGTIHLSPSPRDQLNLRFETRGTGLRYEQYQAASLEASGTLAGSRLTVDGLDLVLDDPETSRIQIGGEADFSARTLDFKYRLAASDEWINRQVEFARFNGFVRSDGSASGSFEQPLLQGRIEPITFTTGATETITFEGNFRGEGLGRMHLSGTARCNGATMELDGALSSTVSGLAINLARFVWSDPERPTLTLETPVDIHILPEDSGAVDKRILVSPFRISGKDLEIAGRFASAQGLELEIRNISLARANRWLLRELPAYLVDELKLFVSEFRPFVLGRVDIHMKEAVATGESLRLDLAARLVPGELVVEQLSVEFSGAPLLDGSVRLPVRIRMPETGTGRPWQLVEAGALEGSISGRTSKPFSNWLERGTGIRIGSATVQFDLEGSLAAPEGVLALNLSELILPASPALPPLRSVGVDASITPDRATVEQFECLINDGSVSGTAEVGVPALLSYLKGNNRDLEALLSKSSGSIRFSGWEAQNWTSRLHPAMRRSGTLEGNLQLRPGLDLSGEARFRDFALRPTRSMPSISEIEGRLSLDDRIVRLHDARASVGGNPVAVAGRIELHDPKRPLWEVSIEGTKVPLVRTTDMILRSDLDLLASNLDRSQPPVLQGRLNLRPSTLLFEFDPLAPSVESGPGRRPPFFSITEAPFADWRFDLSIAGDSFMRVRSPYFRTRLSAAFELGGTFEEPLLIGSMRTIGGELQFPGAKMRLESGEAFIEEGRADEVQLEFSGIAQTPSYVVSMDVSGTLSNPQIQFQSTPALPNSEIVKLLATGSTSGSGIGTVGLYLGKGLLGAGGMEESFADNLSIDVGSGTTRSGRNTVGIRYGLSGDWHLNGEYDVYDAYNLDLVWSIFKR